ncbi:MAG: DUF167 domain-containing protein [Pseudonocardiaceae bacterium]
MRINIRVRPGASRTRVGGEHDGALVVRVGALASDGRATDAALAAVADAFGVRRSAVTLVLGATSRSKIIQIAGGERAVLDELLTQSLYVMAFQAELHLAGPDRRQASGPMLRWRLDHCVGRSGNRPALRRNCLGAAPVWGLTSAGDGPYRRRCRTELSARA